DPETKTHRYRDGVIWLHDHMRTLLLDGQGNQGLRITLGAVGKMAMLFPFKPAAGCWPSAAAVLSSSAARLPSGVLRMDSPQSLSLAHHFRDLPDPRLARLCKHDFLDILTITVCAVICGQHTWTDIELYGETHHDWLKTFLRLPHGI